MATTPGPPFFAKPITTRWLWVVQAAALLSIVLIALHCPVFESDFRKYHKPVLSVLLEEVAMAVPYLLAMGWLRTDRQRRGLELARATAWAGLLAPVVTLVRAFDDMAAFGGIFALSQIALIAAAYGASASIRRQLGERWAQAKRMHWSLRAATALVCFGGLSSLIILPSRTMWPANQASAVGSLRTINTAEVTYASTYDLGFSPTLGALAPPSGDAEPSASAAGLIDSVLAGGKKNAYTFSYSAGPPDKTGHIKTYTVIARPMVYGRAGSMSYFTDESGVLRQTDEDRPATAKDPPIAG